MSHAGPAAACDALEPGLVEPGRGERLGDLPRLGHAERLEALEQLVLGVGGVERVERGLRGRRGERLALQRDERLGVLALDARLDEAAHRRADDVERVGQLGRGALGGGRRVVELVRQPGGHRAERGEPLAVLLDGGDARHHGRDLAHHAAVHRGLRHREAPEVVGLDDRGAAVGLGDHAHRHRPPRHHRDRAHPGRRALAPDGLGAPAVDDHRHAPCPRAAATTPSGSLPCSWSTVPAARS